MNMTWFFDLLSTALYTVFIQNLVFNGGYAASEAYAREEAAQTLDVLGDDRIFLDRHGTRLPRTRNDTGAKHPASALHFAMFSGVLIVVFLITGLILKLALGATEKFLGTLGMAALNTLVLATPLLNRSAAYTLPESIGSGIGAGLAFILAATLICKGLHIISQNQDMPKAFRGTPAAFVYVALLSLAFSGFSGSSLFS